jgi:hypothetical protein
VRSMKLRAGLIVAPVLLLCVAAPAGAEAPQSRCMLNIREVREVGRAWLTAYEARDQRAMSRILDDGFTITCGRVAAAES